MEALQAGTTGLRANRLDKADASFGSRGIRPGNFREENADLAHVLDQFYRLSIFHRAGERDKRWVRVPHSFEAKHDRLAEVDQPHTDLMCLIELRRRKG
jgi:hypothetical protein